MITDGHVRFIELWGISERSQRTPPLPRSESKQEDSFSSKDVQGQAIICKLTVTQHRQHQVNIPVGNASGGARLCTLETLHQLGEDRARPRTVAGGQTKHMAKSRPITSKSRVRSRANGSYPKQEICDDGRGRCESVHRPLATETFKQPPL